jgi:plastocyanin
VRPSTVALAARVAAAAGSAFLIGSCGASDQKPTGPTVAVTITDTTFTPAEITVVVGGAVQWTSASRTERHNIIPSIAGSFKKHETQIKPGESVSITFTKPGDFAYYCAIHGSPTAGQRGIVHVSASAPTVAAK